MKVGVAGAGNWGKNIVRTLHGLGALGGVAEKSAELRAGVESTYPGVPVFEAYEDLLGSGIDAVAIATPAPSHYELAKAAFQRGLDVFVEKPLTLSLSEGEELVRLASEIGCVLMVGHLLLYQPAVQFLKGAIEEGQIGALLSVHQERLNLGRARSVENVLWSLGVHDVAVALWLIGESPKEVEFQGQCALQPNVEDDTYLHLRFPSGARMHLHNSWLWPELRRRTVVIGTKAMLVYDEVAQTLTLHEKSIDSDLQNVNQGERLVYEGAGEPLKLEMEHFIECCKTRQRPISDGESALEVLRVLESASPTLVMS